MHKLYNLFLPFLFILIVINAKAGDYNVKDKLGFISNEGQLDDSDVLYYVKRDGLTLYFFKDGSLNYQLKSYSGKKLNGQNVNIDFLESNKAVQPVPLGEGKTRAVFHKGNALYKTKDFQKLTYENIYENIDLVYYLDNERHVKYDFIVHPGGNPNNIAINYTGNISASLDNEELLLKTPLGSIKENAPLSYVSGNPVKSKYTLKGNTLKFQVADYDKTQTLVIDPVIEMLTSYGGANDDFVENVATDPDGNVYFSGHTNSDNTPTTTGAFQETKRALTDAYIAKVNDEGNLLWATFYGGDQNDFATGITLDDDNNVYVTGYTESQDFPTSGGGKSNKEGGTDLFVLKLSEQGNVLYGGLFGGDSDDEGTDIATDSEGNVYVLGSTASEFFPSGNPIQGSGSDIILMKLDQNVQLQYSSYLGGATGDEGTGLAIDNDGNPVITGQSTSDSGFISSDNVFQSEFGGEQDAFLAKLDKETGDLLWGTYIGGSEQDLGMDVSVDDNNNYYVVGYTSSSDFPTENAYQSTNNGGLYDGFVTKFSSSGEGIWSTYYGGTGSDRIMAVSTDYLNNVYVLTSTQSTDLETTGEVVIQDNNAGGFDIAISSFSSEGDLMYATYYGGTDNDFAVDLISSEDLLYLAGNTESTTIASENISNEGGLDFLISTINVSDIIGGSLESEIVIEDTTICANTYVQIDGEDLNEQFVSVTFSYQYQDSLQGGNWENVDDPLGNDDGTGQDYRELLTEDGMYYYRRISYTQDSSLVSVSNVDSVKVLNQIITGNNLEFGTGETISLNFCEDQIDTVTVIGSDAMATPGEVLYQYAILNPESNEFEEVEGADSSNFEFFPNSVGSYTIGRYAISEENPGCTDLSTITLNVDSQLVENNSISAPSSFLCKDTEVEIEGSTPNVEFGSFTYLYSDSIPGGSWTPIPSSDVKDLTYNLTDDDTSFVRRTIILDDPSYSCRSISNVLQFVADTTYPIATFEYATPGLCDSSIIEFMGDAEESITGRDSVISYMWTFGTFATSMQQDTSVLFEEGVYDVTLEVTGINGCKDDTTVELTIYDNPEVDAGPSLVLEAGEMGQLDASTNITEFDSIYWLPETGLSDPNILDPEVTLNNPEEFIITVVDTNGCMAMDTTMVGIISDSLLDTNNVVMLDQEPACRETEFTIDGSDLGDILGITGFMYQYQDSIPGGSWENVTDPLNNDDGTNMDYTETLTTPGTYFFRRIATSPVGSFSDTSNIVSVTVVDEEILSNTLIFDAATGTTISLCEDDDSGVEILGSSATADSGSEIDYQYAIYDSSNEAYIDIEGATSQNYTFDLDSSAGTYTIGRYAISEENPTCFDLYTVQIILDSSLVEENIISSNSNLVCEGTSVFIDGSLPEVDPSLYDFVYYDSIPGGTWMPLGSEFEQEDISYSLNGADTSYVRRAIIPTDLDNSCISYSNILEFMSDTTSPQASFTFEGNLCEDNLIEFTAETSEDDENYTYRYTFGNIGTSTQADTVFNFEEGTYDVTLEVTSEAGCVDDTTIELVINDNPEVDAGPDIVINEGEVEQLQATTTATNIDSVYWTPPTGLSNPEILQPEVTVSDRETYRLTVVDNNGCTGTDTVEVVTVSCEQVDTSNIISSPQETYCLGSETEITGTDLANIVGTPTFDYQYQDSIPGGSWADIPGATEMDYSQSQPVAAIIFYRRIATSPNDLCEDTSNVLRVEILDQTILNNDISFTNGTGSSVTVCEENGTPIEIGGTTAIAGSGNVSYQYVIYNSETDTYEDLEGATGEDLSFPSDTTPGTYQIGRYAISDETPECQDLTTIEVNIDEQLVSENTITASSTFVCDDTEAEIIGSVPEVDGSSFNYVYYDSIPGGNWMEITGSDMKDLTYTLEENDTVYIMREVMLTDANSCESFSNTLELIKDTTFPTASFTYTTEGLCEGNEIQFTDVTEDPTITSRNWDFGGEGTSTDEMPTFTFDAGTYDITLEVMSESGCEDDTVVQLTINNNPQVSINAGEEILIAEDEVKQIPVTTTGSTISDIMWTPEEGLSNPNVLEPEVSTDSDQEYILTVEDINNCMASDTVFVNFYDEFFIPTAFTPNGDGFNDRFEIVGIERYPNAEIYIYNRWGIKVFESQDLENNSWNGTQNGESVPSGVYYYVLDLKNNSDLMEGTITILR